MKARISNGVVVEFLQPIPGCLIEDCFHPSVLAQCVDFVEGMEIDKPFPLTDEVAVPSPDSENNP